MHARLGLLFRPENGSLVWPLLCERVEACQDKVGLKHAVDATPSLAHWNSQQ